MAEMSLLTANAQGGLVLGVNRSQGKVTGIDKLVQIVTVIMLNNGRRSIFRPGDAAGLRQLIGANYDLSDPAELFTDVRIMLSGVERVIKQSQVMTRRPPSERLSELQLVDIQPAADDSSVHLIVHVVSEAGSAARALVPVP